MKRALTIQNLLDKKFKTIGLTGEFYEAFGNPEESGMWFIWGKSGNGKTNFVMQLFKELTKHLGRGLYVSYEEGAGKTFVDALIRSGLSTVGSKMLVITLPSKDPIALIEEIRERMKRQRSPKFVVIDSYQYTGLSVKQYFELKDILKNKLLIFTSHASGNLPSTRPAYTVHFDASLKIFVEGYRAYSKGREYGPNGGMYTVWKEGAERYDKKLQ